MNFIGNAIIYVKDINLAKEALKRPSIVAVILAEPAFLKQLFSEDISELGFPVLIKDDVAFFDENKLDGVYFDSNISLNIFKQIRKKYPDAQLGVNTGISRHNALLFAEAGADFVVFKGDLENIEEITEWWVSSVEVPCVAWQENEDSLENYSAETDFVMHVV